MKDIITNNEVHLIEHAMKLGLGTIKESKRKYIEEVQQTRLFEDLDNRLIVNLNEDIDRIQALLNRISEVHYSDQYLQIMDDQ